MTRHTKRAIKGNQNKTLKLSAYVQITHIYTSIAKPHATTEKNCTKGRKRKLFQNNERKEKEKQNLGCQQERLSNFLGASKWQLTKPDSRGNQLNHEA